MDARLELGHINEKDQQELVEAHEKKIKKLTDECAGVCTVDNLKFCFNFPQFEKKNKPENVTYVSDGQANSLLVRKDYLYLISNVLSEY